MGIYFVILILLFSFSCLDVYLNKDKKAVKFLFAICCLFFIIFSGIRYDVGVDYMNYKEMYDSAGETDEVQKEFLLSEVFQFCKQNNIAFQFIVFGFSVFTVSLAFRSIWRYSPFVFFSILIFFSFGQYYFNSFNAMRQVLAVYCFFNLFDSIRWRRWKFYFFVIFVCAMLVHASAILLLPFYFILHRHFPMKLKVVIIAMCFLLKPILVYLISQSPYAIYLKFEQFASDVSASSYFLLLLSIFFLFLDWRKIKLLSDERMNVLLYNMNYLSFLFLLLLILFANTPLVMVVNRFSYYFTPIYIILLPIFVNKFNKQDNRFFVVIIASIIFSLICCMTICMNGTSNNLVPYQIFFSIK